MIAESHNERFLGLVAGMMAVMSISASRPERSTRQQSSSKLGVSCCTRQRSFLICASRQDYCDSDPKSNSK